MATVHEPGGPLTLWSWKETGEVYDGQVVAKDLHAVAFNPDGDTIAYVTEAGDVAIMDVANRKPLRILRSYANQIENAGVTPDGSVLAIQVWYDSHFDLDLKSGTLIKNGPILSYNNAGNFSQMGQLGGGPFTVEKMDDRVTIQTADGHTATVVMLDKISAWVATDELGASTPTSISATSRASTGSWRAGRSRQCRSRS